MPSQTSPVGKFTHSYYSKLLPNNFDNYFIPVSSIHSYPTRLSTSNRLFLPGVNPSSGKCSITTVAFSQYAKSDKRGWLTRWPPWSFTILRDTVPLLFTLISYFAIVFLFILISTDNWFSYCAMGLSIVSV